MSWEPAYSFGNPSAQPPTPGQTPTSGQFPSPTFETPKASAGFENRSGWTPTFAEEYSVFHSTPGRLIGDQNSFLGTPIQHPSIAVEQNTFSGNISADIASHVHQLSPNPSVSLAAVDTSSQLAPSPNPFSNSLFDDSAKKKVTPRRPEKRLDEPFSGQTATPPQSAHKGSRKLAPKLSTGTMQNDGQDSHYGMSETPTHDPDFSAFPSTTDDMFGYPLSAPATAPVFSDAKNFWDPDASMSGMDLDFTTEDTAIFTTGHRVANSFDWGRNNQIFQESINIQVPVAASPPAAQSIAKQPVKRQRPLAPKAPKPLPAVEAPKSLPPFDFNNTTTASNDLFGGSVDPGLLFSRNNSISSASAFEDVNLPPPRPATSHIVREPYQHQLRESRRDQEELRRTRSTRDRSSGRSFGRETVSSPVKGSARPGLHRSFSDSKGKRPQGRLASRTGRSSPVKQQRPAILPSILESPQPGPRTEVIFTIDSNGKARTETVYVGRDSSPRKSAPPSVKEEWDSSPYESSTDDELIIVPSRNTSFSLPQQPKDPKLASFETARRSNELRRQSTGASGYSHSESSSQHSLQMDGVESEAETVMEEDSGLGDATRELRKVMEDRKKIQMKQKQRNPRHHHYAQDSRGSYYRSSQNLSPTTISDLDRSTPSSSRSGNTRCVCNKPEDDRFMIQCESCENWLHAECINLDRKSVPSVYICRFCAQTPNMRGGRIRDSIGVSTTHASSPLAHKTFKSFR
ncbi:hypothetical protein B0O99DRAFT_594442 [Bisporella sp. PMI_857]|nr:hypothetical protein B0O99DRAFT_594442 [Bisporella sp. PMI_857]